MYVNRSFVVYRHAVIATVCLSSYQLHSKNQCIYYASTCLYLAAMSYVVYYGSLPQFLHVRVGVAAWWQKLGFCPNIRIFEH